MSASPESPVWQVARWREGPLSVASEPVPFTPALRQDWSPRRVSRLQDPQPFTCCLCFPWAPRPSGEQARRPGVRPRRVTPRLFRWEGSGLRFLLSGGDQARARQRAWRPRAQPASESLGPPSTALGGSTPLGRRPFPCHPSVLHPETHPGLCPGLTWAGREPSRPGTEEQTGSGRGPGKSREHGCFSAPAWESSPSMNLT